MIHAYRKMELPDLADKSETVYHENFPTVKCPRTRDQEEELVEVLRLSANAHG